MMFCIIIIAKITIFRNIYIYDIFTKAFFFFLYFALQLIINYESSCFCVLNPHPPEPKLFHVLGENASTTA